MFLGITFSVELIALLFTVFVAVLGALNFLFSVFMKYISSMIKQKLGDTVIELEKSFQSFHSENAENVEANKDNLALLKQAVCNQKKMEVLRRENILRRLTYLETHCGFTPIPPSNERDHLDELCNGFEDDL